MERVVGTVRRTWRAVGDGFALKIERGDRQYTSFGDLR